MLMLFDFAAHYFYSRSNGLSPLQQRHNLKTMFLSPLPVAC